MDGRSREKADLSRGCAVGRGGGARPSGLVIQDVSVWILRFQVCSPHGNHGFLPGFPFCILIRIA